MILNMATPEAEEDQMFHPRLRMSLCAILGGGSHILSCDTVEAGCKCKVTGNKAKISD